MGAQFGVVLNHVAGGLYNIALGVQYNMTNLDMQFAFGPGSEAGAACKVVSRLGILQAC